MLNDLYYTINHSINFTCSIFIIAVALLVISLVIWNRQCRNFTNVLTCNTCSAVAFHFILRFLTVIFVFRDDWDTTQPACHFRAYLSLMTVTAILYSYVAQATSHLFFAFFYRYRSLLTWRAHWILIAINWSSAILIAFPPYLQDQGFYFNPDTRLCTFNQKKSSVTIYVGISMLLIPTSIVISIYTSIFCRFQRLNRRVAVCHSISEDVNTKNRSSTLICKREFKLMKDISAQVIIAASGCVPYAITIASIPFKGSATAAISYLLAYTSISIGSTVMMIVLFTMNKSIKNAASKLIIGYRPTIFQNRAIYPLPT